MNLGKLGQAITGKEIFDLIHDDLDRVEKEISLETVASVDVVTPVSYTHLTLPTTERV